MKEATCCEKLGEDAGDGLQEHDVASLVEITQLDGKLHQSL